MRVIAANGCEKKKKRIIREEALKLLGEEDEFQSAETRRGLG